MSNADPIKVIQFGVGNAGSEMVRQMRTKQTLAVVGAVDIDPEKFGRDLGRVAGLNADFGIPIRKTLAEVLRDTSADLVLHATAPDIPQIVRDVSDCVRAGLDVISISGIFHIKKIYPQLYDQLDSLAREKGVSVLGSGTTPGFFSDALLAVLTGICAEVESVNFRRVVDMDEWGPGLYDVFGLGFTPERFENAVRKDEISLHDRLLQVHDQLADTLGWDIDDLQNRKEFLTAKDPRSTPHITVEPGDVCGFRHTVTGKRDGKLKISIEYIGIINPNPEKDGLKVETVLAVNGEPSFTFSLGGDLIDKAKLQYVSVAAHPINGIPHVAAARPGIVTRRELPTFIPLK